MSTSRKWTVSKYAWWDPTLSKWQVPVAQNDQTLQISLVVKGAQFSLIIGRTLVESFSLVQKPKATRIHVKGHGMAVITKHGEKFRKFRMLFDSSKDVEEASQVLGNYVQIGGDKPVSTSQEQQNTNRGTLPEMLEQLMSSPDPQLPAPESIPEDYPLESAVRLCILDPGFPSLVHRVEHIINNHFK